MSEPRLQSNVRCACKDHIYGEETWAAATAGCATAWRSVVDRYSGLVSATIASFRLQQADSADASQATWLKLIENAHAVRHAPSLGGWLVTTARRECVNIIHRSSRCHPTDDWMLDHIAEPGKTPEEEAVDSDTNTRLWASVDQLNHRRKTVIHALYEAEASYAEVTKACDVPIGSIGPTRARALQELHELLNDDAA